ncbi:serine/threonine-protein kinase [Streptococcus oralis]|uniref:serine/threonine-protein kinase n=1 Tax=Streptococcus oralis TaxID=1303 RepID=UPI0019D12FD4|nr:serine/threonine-protein kinase [Streptococcus oralis]MBN6013673.1 serine/threonine protein kinase [Streptococcus oralis subsp. oralis]
MDLTNERIDDLKNQFKIDEILQFIGYCFIKILGQGGQGVVVLTNDSTGIEKAVKIMKLPTSRGRANRAKIERLKNDIEFCSQYNHENIIKYHLHGEYPNDGQRAQFLYAVMDYFPKNLRDVIDESENYSPEQRLNYLIQLSKGINAAHDKGIIHRDIKPENILIRDENLVLSDFGIAHFEGSDLTVADDLLANRNYLSPEQKKIGKALNITFASDVYSFGLIINECFTGENPDGSEYKRIWHTFPYLFELDKLVDRLINPSPDSRPSSDSVRMDLKLLKAELDSEKEDLKYVNTGGHEIEDKDRILKISSEDLIFSQFVLNDLSNESLKELNFNYHCSINYRVTDELHSNFLLQQIMDKCEAAFSYESVHYFSNNLYSPLDIFNNPEDISLFEKMREILLSINGDKVISGKILKFFSSCCSYHCKEILRDIDVIIQKTKEEIFGVPILYLIKYLRKNHFKLNQSEKLYDKIRLDWTNYKGELKDSPLELPLFKRDLDFYQHKKNRILEILGTIALQFPMDYYEIDSKNYSLKFDNQFNKGIFHIFKYYCLSKTKKGSIFEADVLNLFRNIRTNDEEGIVELVISTDFDVEITLSKIFIDNYSEEQNT